MYNKIPEEFLPILQSLTLLGINWERGRKSIYFRNLDDYTRFIFLLTENDINPLDYPKPFLGNGWLTGKIFVFKFME